MEELLIQKTLSRGINPWVTSFHWSCCLGEVFLFYASSVHALKRLYWNSLTLHASLCHVVAACSSVQPVQDASISRLLPWAQEAKVISLHREFYEIWRVLLCFDYRSLCNDFICHKLQFEKNKKWIILEEEKLMVAALHVLLSRLTVMV